MAKQATDFSRELTRLRLENEALKQKLQSKRYRAIDGVVDTFYRIVRGKQPTLATYEQSARSGKKSTRVPKRKIDTGRVDIVNVNFFNWDGDTVFLGGAERYVYDLALLLKKKGYRPRILQGANHDFTKKYRGIEVVGLEMPDPAINVMSKMFSSLCVDAEMVICSPLELACELNIDAPVIGINHGINFDHPQTTFQNTSGSAYSFYQMALENVDYCVCVDTNFINWVRTRDYGLSTKLLYVPNYYDEKIFKPTNKKRGGKIRFVYPRRIYAARGADITIEAFDRILNKYSDKAELQLIGQIDNDEIGERVKYLMDKYPQNVFQGTYPPDEMNKAYSNADVVLIPTRYSEGTSLSCIEAMASGVAVISTNVGGLPNLVINNFNGLLIDPNAKALEKSILNLIEHPAIIQKLAKNAALVAKTSFTKKAWENQWSEIIDEL